MSLTEHLKAAHQRHQSLRNFIKENAVPDTGINMRNGRPVLTVVPIEVDDSPLLEFKPNLPAFVPTLDEYGPPNPLTEAFGPVVHELEPIEKRISIAQIQKIVCKYYEVTKAEICSQRRHAHLVKARQVGMYLSKILTVQSYPSIGSLYGGKDHTTCMHAFRKIECLRTHDIELDSTLNVLASEIRGAA